MPTSFSKSQYFLSSLRDLQSKARQSKLIKSIFKNEIIDQERQNLYLWIPIIFAFGCAFFINYFENFLTKKLIFFTFFSSAIIFSFLDRKSFRTFIYSAIAIFIAGIFYTFFYEKILLNYTKITGKVYVDGIGKIESIKYFHNAVNQLDGQHFVISDLELEKAQFNQKKSTKRTQRKEIKKPRKNFLNLNGYQALSRVNIDLQNNYQEINWLEKNDKKYFPNPPKKISINLVKANKDLEVNDRIKFKALFEPFVKPEFSDSFNYELDFKAKKIGASGYAVGAIEITKKNEISSFNTFFLNLREKIRNQLNLFLPKNEAAIASALLIGDQKTVDKNFYEKIRNAGLAHLLSISGFHLSLAGAIFFLSARFLLSFSSSLMLNFNIKQLAAFFALFSCFIYLQIAGAPIPAKRAFLMVLCIFLALILNERLNSKRVICASMLVLIILNPYAIFNAGFQLSFVAVLILATIHEELKFKIENKFWRYFFEIILVSLFIQIISLPFILHGLGNVALYGFLANILAIPLSSFVIMPLGFLSLILMPIGLEKYVLILMGKAIFALEKVIIWINNIPFADFVMPQLSNLGFVISVVGVCFVLFHKNILRYVGILLFILGISQLSFAKKPDLILEKEQKFFAIFDKKNGLVFSKKIRPSKQRQLWLKHFNEDEFKIGNFCNKNLCKVTHKNKKILVIFKRSKINEICASKFDLIVNLTKKYELPKCVRADEIIDNADFLDKKTKEIFL